MKSSTITPLQRKCFYKQEVSVLMMLIGCFIAACSSPMSSNEPTRTTSKPAPSTTSLVGPVVEPTNQIKTLPATKTAVTASPTPEPTATVVIPTIQVGDFTILDPRIDPKSMRFFYMKEAIVDGEIFIPPIPLLANAFEKAGIMSPDGTKIIPQQILENLVFSEWKDKDGIPFLVGAYHLDPIISSELGLSSGEIPIIIGEINEQREVDWQDSTSRILAKKNRTVVGATAFYPIWGDELGRNMRRFLAKHFNGLILEQHYSWRQVEKEKGSPPNSQRVSEVKQLIEFADTYDMTLIGRPVFFSEHYPGWLKEGSFTKGELHSFIDKRLRDTVGNFPEISIWELTNELHDIKLGWNQDALQASGLSLNELQLYVFQKAMEINPDARYMTSDVASSGIPSGRVFPMMLSKINFLLNNGVPVSKILAGLHGHMDGSNFPTYNQLLLGAEAYPVKKIYTEVDINMKDVPLSNPKREIRQAKGFADMLRTCLRTDCEGVYIWDPGDNSSWLEHQSQIGQPYYSRDADATPFNDDLSPKIAYYAMMAVLLENLQE